MLMLEKVLCQRGENKLDILLMENVTELHAISLAFSSI